MLSTGTRRMRRIFVIALAAVVSLSGIALAGGGGLGGGGNGGEKTSGVVYAGATHIEGDDLYVAGEFEDELLGRGAIVYVTQPDTTDAGTILVKARKITIYTRKGSLSGKGRATQAFHQDGTSTVSDGKFKLKKGTGAYRDNKFKGTFDGTFEDGVYTFDYVGIFK